MFTLGLMAESSTANGTTTKCMATEYSLGTMGACTQGNISMTRSRAREFSPGQTEESMMENGETVNSTE